MSECLQCGKQTPNPKFCNRSCAAKYNNANKPKRKRSRKCKKCGTLILSQRIYCNNCYTLRGARNQNLTLGEAIYSKNGYRANAYALIRVRARTKIKQLGWTKCVNCGYDKHVQAAHKKPISSFSDDTLVCDINATSNLVALCPNCHWEFDNGLLQL